MFYQKSIIFDFMFNFQEKGGYNYFIKITVLLKEL